jgi:hypothetical protein
MTVEDLVVEVFELIGESSDLEIYTPGTTTVSLSMVGTIKILKWINRAYKRIVNWKFPNGSQVRFPIQSGELFFKTLVISGTVASSPTSSTVTLDTMVSWEDDRYNGYIIEITAGLGVGQVRLIVDFGTPRTATVDRVWDTAPDGTSTYSLYKREYFFREPLAFDAGDNIMLSPVTQIAAILKISDPSGSFDLQQGGRLENYAGSLLVHGNPTSYLPLGASIVFDVAPDTEKWYRLEYSKIPNDLTVLTDRPLIPESFHEALLLYAQWIALRRSQEWGGAYATKKDIEDIMSSLKSSLEMAFEREDIGALVV